VKKIAVAPAITSVAAQPQMTKRLERACCDIARGLRAINIMIAINNRRPVQGPDQELAAESDPPLAWRGD
jgi:hypothetical protein